MKGGKTPKTPRTLSGYTIIEVMIVLAVSSVMFLIAASFINGKQERTAFTEGSNDLVSALQNTAEDIVDGHYSDVPIVCTVTGGGSLQLDQTNTSNQGTNQDCVFLGKIVYFTGSPNRNNYETFSIAAARSISGSLPNNQVAAIPYLTTQVAIPQALYVKSMSVVDTLGHTHTDVYSIGFAQGLGTADPASGVYLSGAQTVGLIYGDPGTWDEAHLVGTVIQPAKSAAICLTDGTRYAEILIGGSTTGASSNNGNQLSISAQQLGTTPC